MLNLSCRMMINHFTVDCHVTFSTRNSFSWTCTARGSGKVLSVIVDTRKIFDGCYSSTVAAVQPAHKFGAPPSVKESRPYIDLSSRTTHNFATCANIIKIRTHAAHSQNNFSWNSFGRCTPQAFHSASSTNQESLIIHLHYLFHKGSTRKLDF